jgi:uncharacterized protein YbjQ (UPF0145 family)
MGPFVLLIYIVPPLVLFSLGYFIGGRTEKRHFGELDEREARSNVIVSQVKSFPFAVSSDLPPQIMVTEVVIGSDYLKSFLAGLRNIFGGEVKSFQTLLTRSRREALLRLTEQAESQGYNAICNVRFDTATIGGSGGKKVHMSAVLASATAYVAKA